LQLWPGVEEVAIEVNSSCLKEAAYLLLESLQVSVYEHWLCEQHVWAIVEKSLQQVDCVWLQQAQSLERLDPLVNLGEPPVLLED